ncbi:MAG: alpha-L-fucosidase [Spirochaetia bacterium]|nr:alpha-L-fucosidase [Spirochaetia bacterium]
MENSRQVLNWFTQARYGLFIHYGLYSLLGRGEWAMNREGIPLEEYQKLKDLFSAEYFNADDIIRRAKDWGMRYAVLTTKHHDGFCLYDSKLTDFTAPKSPARRDLVAEFVDACRKHSLRIGLYHTLNDWSASPSAVDALEDPKKNHERFIDRVHGGIREILSNYGKIDVMWYDGWWPFDAKGWQAEKLNGMVRTLQPGILVNGRSGLTGDFGTPEGHVSSSMEPWEACITLNENWGYHAGDPFWKSPGDVTEMLRKCSAGQGNLLLNLGLKGDGTLPEEQISCLDRVGVWLKQNHQAIYNTERFEFSLRERGEGRAEWNHHGAFTASGNHFYWHIRHWPGSTITLAGVKCKVTCVTDIATGKAHPFQQKGNRIEVTGFNEIRDTSLPVVIRFSTEDRPMLYLCGGLREPNVEHCHYDPLLSDIAL